MFLFGKEKKKKKKMEVKFNKAWFKRKGFQRPFFAARQLPREMSKGSHRQGGCAAQRDNKNPSRLMHYDPGLARLGSMERHQAGQAGRRGGSASQKWPREADSPVSGPSQASKWRKGRKEWDDALGGEAESCLNRDHAALEVRRSDQAPALHQLALRGQCVYEGCWPWHLSSLWWIMKTFPFQHLIWISQTSCEVS